ncbi:uncharacterized protein LOC130534741 [Takifugu flavidus]|uniref:Ig-like domain-containing protein n=1 Tax=Takifugu flavidus TaxID=433684 RepID=A0A5C6PFE8_9TELE|nr:uncharacterized protein LOC130534741 [Takifugu flavidus]TWW77501.1 hypothetical protein D4764_12G0008910 [Takifugu flavidus]
MGVKSWLAALLICLTSGVKSNGDAVFVYSRIGGNLLLPCGNLLLPDCSAVSWTFFTNGGSWLPVQLDRAGPESQQTHRASFTSNCSVSLRDLREEDAASYSCAFNGRDIITFYVSLLTISSPSTITSLQPGGNLSLSCILFTYYNAGNCRSLSMFNLSWVSGDGTTLPSDNRLRLIRNTRCNITLVTNLETADNNRKWRCQVNTREETAAVFLDFRSTFLFESSLFGKSLIFSALPKCPFQLPMARILLCVVVTIVLVTVGVFTWRKEKDIVRTSAADHLQTVTTSVGL